MTTTSLGEALAQAIDDRLASGVRIERIAVDLNVSTVAVRNWRSQESQPGGDRMAQVLAYFGIFVVYQGGSNESSWTHHIGPHLRERRELEVVAA